MLWFFIADLAAGAPLRTPALLGAAVFGQGSEGDWRTNRVGATR